MVRWWIGLVVGMSAVGVLTSPLSAQNEILTSPNWLAEMIRGQRNHAADEAATASARLQQQEIELAKVRASALASDAWWHKCVNDPGCVAWTTGAGVVPAPNSSGIAAPKEQK